jgi:hypothetical protein
MKILPVFFSILACFLFSCKKDSFITSPDARLVTSTDKLKFDTVFTSVGSVTQSFTIVNDNDQKLRLSQIKLGGGSSSAFAINVDGVPGTSFSNLELNAHDSIYVFVKVTIDPNAANAAFVVDDSVEINYNGSLSKVYLQAYGQNARFITNEHITSNTTWDKTLPYVIQHTLYVDKGVTLTLEKGTRVYCNATAAFIVNGTLRSMGEKEDSNRVVFRGDRLDAAYKDLPGSWAGLLFSNTSTSSELHFTNILNAYQAVAIGNAVLQMDHCTISNAYDIGLYALNASVTASDCLISQCGNEGQAGTGGSNVILTGGGTYDFTHCTLVTYANYYQNHKQPVLFVSNNDAGSIAPLNANFTNCIVYGNGGTAENELLVTKAASDKVIFTNTLYKVKDDQPGDFIDPIKNQDPLFDTINVNLQTYSFRLREGSPAIAAGKALAIPGTDLDGNPRPAPPTKPDMGSYQKQ